MIDNQLICFTTPHFVLSCLRLKVTENSSNVSRRSMHKRGAFGRKGGTSMRFTYAIVTTKDTNKETHTTPRGKKIHAHRRLHRRWYHYLLTTEAICVPFWCAGEWANINRSLRPECQYA